MSQNLKQFQIKPKDVNKVYFENYLSLMADFYENQNLFLTGIQKRYKNLESANIVLFFAKYMHLQIIREREKIVNFDISYKNVWNNIQNVEKPKSKIVSVVSATGIPKETVRRKIKILLTKGYLNKPKSFRGYSWNLEPYHIWTDLFYLTFQF